jgi:hypothetical protein
MAKILFKESEATRTVPFEGVWDLNGLGEIVGVEVLDFRRQIGVKPPPPDPVAKLPRWSYDEEIDAFYVRLRNDNAPRQETRKGLALLDREGAVVALEAEG